MAVTPGTRLEQYEIVRLIGAGGMGEVYLARDTRLDRSVALKILPASIAEQSERLRRFIEESRTASALNHPNILTVYDAGESNGLRFIATEFVDGKTLRDALATERMPVLRALDIATQIAAALSAAHAAGIVHRDIKPENVMLRTDGLVKVLDFGLAKLVQQESSRSDDAPTVAAETAVGIVLGTAKYMSPEQARGLTVDARTDIFSLGVILYEMLAGRPPWNGATAADVTAAMLSGDAPPLDQLAASAPRELRQIAAKAMRKDRDLRYQSIKDLLIDLRDVRQDVEFQSRPGSEPRATARPRWRLATLIALAAAILVAAAVFAVLRLNRAPALTDKDTILIADFANTTGDAVFDDTLKQGLAVQLAQSPFLNIFPDDRARQTLRLMNRPQDSRVNAQAAREICQREGLKAFLEGSIANLGSHYVVTLTAINAQSGDVIGRAQVEAESKEQVLKALSQAASMTRGQLGESLSSIQKFDAPLELTTSSLDALKAWSLGNEQSVRGKYFDATIFFKRAIELDPNFAYAYIALAVMYGNTNQPGLAAQYAEKAFGMRDRVSELEKLRVSYFYHSRVTGDVDKAIDALELFRRTYPRDYRTYSNLADRYLRIGQFAKAVEAAREGVALNANSAASYTNLGQALTGLNRFSEAKQVYEKALQQNLASSAYHTGLYQIAFVEHDADAMRREVEWARGKPNEYIASDWQAQAAAFGGELRRAATFAHEAAAVAARSNAREIASQYVADEALRDAVLDDCDRSRAALADMPAGEGNLVTRPRTALARTLCGDAGHAQPLRDQLASEHPSDTVVNVLGIPEIDAAIELRRGRSPQAIAALDVSRRYESGAEFWPTYLRGLAWLQQRGGAEAAAEFKRIIEHRGEGPMSVLYPLAHLGLARAAVLSGDSVTARAAYQNLFDLWKRADPDLPPLLAAKREYSQLTR